MTGKCRLHTSNTIVFASPDRKVSSQYRLKAIRRHSLLKYFRHFDILKIIIRISSPSILSRPGSFSIRLTLEPTHPSRLIPWIIQTSQNIDDRKIRFAEIEIRDLVPYLHARILKYCNFWARTALCPLIFGRRRCKKSCGLCRLESVVLSGSAF